MTSRTPTRVQLGDAAVLSPREACELLPWRDDTAMAWLRKHGLVREEMMPDGTTGEYVLWDEVRRTLRAREVATPRNTLPAPKRRAL